MTGLHLRAAPLIGLAATVLLVGSAAAQVTVLRGATLIDGSGAVPQSNVTIVIENGRLRDIGTGATAPVGATVIDVAGKFVVPGIINGHGHVGPPGRQPCRPLQVGHRQIEPPQGDVAVAALEEQFLAPKQAAAKVLESGHAA